MPGRDGTGPPWGGGPRTGRGAGRGGKGAGRMRGTRPSAGSTGECICPSCGARIPHQAGIPCYKTSCPECGSKLVR